MTSVIIPVIILGKVIISAKVISMAGYGCGIHLGIYNGIRDRDGTHTPLFVRMGGIPPDLEMLTSLFKTQ